jgi:membrane associated rhomboid family serine protease
MFPLRAVHKTLRPPLITRVLITVNIVVFIAQWLPGVAGDWARHIKEYGGVQPHCYFAPSACGVTSSTGMDALWKPLLFSMFLHAGVLHLALNMLFLSVFGAGLEEKLGKLRFLIFYVVCGLAATGAQIVTHPLSDATLIGASGAIAGVLGAYLVLLPRSWILTYFPPIFLFPLPAPLFLLLWLAAQIAAQFVPAWNRVLESGSASQNVAWMAHIGGFACGALWAWKVRAKAR